jgi:sensor histidine kinase regulating citrate/malate metabolism
MSDQSGGWVREPIIPSKEILANVLASGHDDFTAMEDIIDNAIEALSSVSGETNYKPEIKVTISESSIQILDNGCGMSNAQARNAMRLGAHMVQGSIAGVAVQEKDHFLFGSGRLGH